MSGAREEERSRELEFEALPGDGGMRLDLFLSDRMEWRSRSSIKKLIAEGKVELKNRESALKASSRVREGDIFSVSLPVPKRDLDGAASLGPDPEIEVLYEDRWILVVNKPAGIPVHPAGRLLDRTVVTALRRSLAERGDARPGDLKLCHRLDLETSGVLLLSKDPATMPAFASKFERREVSKEYLALVHGEVEQDRGEIDLPIGLARDSRITMKRGIRRHGGQRALTGFAVEKRFAGFTLVRLFLHTGRHHQIRVHLSAAGHPVVGDKVYGLDESFFLLYFEGRLGAREMEKLLLPRQALHAHRLGLRHEVLGKEMTFEAPLPEDILRFMEGLEER